MNTTLLSTTALTPQSASLCPIAYSLIRFSTPGQADGDSYRRQFAPQQRFCDARGWELDLSLHHATLRKFAVSASKDIKKTPFYRFVMMVEKVGLPRDRQLILLAEDIDRMCRGIHDVVYDLCLRLMRAGCWLVTTMDGTIYTLAGINDPDSGQRDKLLRKLDAAADYSVKLGTRVKESWIARAERVEAGEIYLTEASPEWLMIVNEAREGNRRISGDFAIDAVRGATVRYAHKLGRVSGMGKRKAAQLLNAANAAAQRDGHPEPHPPWRGSSWQPSAIQRIWENRAVFGEATLFRGRTVKPRYYPPVLAGPSGPDGTYIEADYEEAERLFYLGAAERARRKWKGPLHKGERHANILPDAECNCEAFDKHGNLKRGKLHYLDKGHGPKSTARAHNTYLVCDHALRKVPLVDGSLCQNRRHYRHPELEQAMMTILPAFDFTRLLSRPDPHTAEIGALEAMVKEKTDRANWLREYGQMTGDNMRAINKLTGEADAAREKLSALHKDAKIAEAEAQREAFQEFVTLVTTMEGLEETDPECVRTRSAIAQQLRRVIEIIRVDGDGVIAWMPGVDGWFQIGFRLSGLAFDRAAVVVEMRQTGGGSIREEYPLSFSAGCLEPYLDRDLADRLNGMVLGRAKVED